MSSADQEKELKAVEDGLKLLRSDEWKEYIYFLKDRGKRLQEDVNKAVKEGRPEDARIALAVMDDSKKQVKVFVDQVITKNEKLKEEGVK